MSSAPTTSPLVSVVVPLYNKRHTIGRAIDSVLAQTWRDFELIVVDDGSTDGSAERAAACDDTRVKVIRQRNAGPGAARNRGAAEGTTEFVAFLDADDAWAPRFLETSLDGIRANPECTVSCAARIFSPENELRLPEPSIRTGPWRMPTTFNGYQARNAVHFLHASALVCTKAVFEKYGGFYTEKSDFGEDTYLLAQFAFGESVFRIREPLVTFHREASNLSQWRKSPRPIPPIISEPDRLRHSCPPSHQPLFGRFLDDYASLMARDAAIQGNASVARRILSIVEFRGDEEQRTRRLRKEAQLLIPLHRALRQRKFRNAYRRVSRLFPAEDRLTCIPKQ